jgi:hypothetical protein
MIGQNGSLADQAMRVYEVLELKNEFAAVEIGVDHSANGPRLRIENCQNRRVVYLDPLELASLTWLTHDHLGPFLDPSQTGWGNDENGE